MGSAHLDDLLRCDPSRLIGRDEGCLHDTVDAITECEIGNPVPTFGDSLNKTTCLNDLEIVVAERITGVSEEGGVITMPWSRQNPLIPPLDGNVGVAVEVEFVHSLLVEAQGPFGALKLIREVALSTGTDTTRFNIAAGAAFKSA